jgi:hypothetical protein
MPQLRNLGGLGVAGLLLLFVVAPGSVARADVFSVSDLQVDERADSVVAAKKEGIAKAQRIALRAVLQRLTLQVDHDGLPAIDDKTVVSLLRDYTITQEKFGGDRYLARLNVRFHAKEVRKFLRAAGTSYAETVSPAVVVLPVLQRRRSLVLWDDPNPWFDAWSNQPPPSGLVPMILPQRDLSDVSVIDARDALGGDAEKISAIAGKYSARGAIVMHARAEGSRSSGLGLSVTATRHHPGEGPVELKRNYTAPAGVEEAAFYDWVAGQVIAYIEETWKQENLQQVGVTTTVRVVVPLTGLGDWVAVRNTMEAVPTIDRFKLSRLSVQEAEVTVTVNGEPEQLQKALARKGLDMEYAVERSAWVVYAHRR